MIARSFTLYEFRWHIEPTTLWKQYDSHIIIRNSQAFLSLTHTPTEKNQLEVLRRKHNRIANETVLVNGVPVKNIPLEVTFLEKVWLRLQTQNPSAQNC